ncbi:MAG: arginine decarboxylase, partial [Myxococcales bacterium]|nr:arginine decarboxylase [Myxococcales bacterium]
LIDRFIGIPEERTVLPLHTRNGGPYFLGVFLIGAYQEILGDLHNLFGDTHAIHVTVADNKRGYQVLHLDEGDIIEEVLSYVHHDAKRLVRRLREKVEVATDAGRMSIEDGAELVRTFVRGLDDYTYLSR